MALNIEEENFVKDIYIDKVKQDQISALLIEMLADVEELKKLTTIDKWVQIVARKYQFYSERDAILKE